MNVTCQKCGITKELDDEDAHIHSGLGLEDFICNNCMILERSSRLMTTTCKRCKNTIKLTYDNWISPDIIQHGKVVCEDCIGWYKTGGIEGKHVVEAILFSTFDKYNVRLSDRFKNEKLI